MIQYLVCDNCGEPGHLFRQCPNQQRRTSSTTTSGSAAVQEMADHAAMQAENAELEKKNAELQKNNDELLAKQLQMEEEIKELKLQLDKKDAENLAAQDKLKVDYCFLINLAQICKFYRPNCMQVQKKLIDCSRKLQIWRQRF